MNLTHSEALVGQLEESPERVPLCHGDLETMIASLMEDIYQLSLTGAGNEPNMTALRNSIGPQNRRLSGSDNGVFDIATLDSE